MADSGYVNIQQPPPTPVNPLQLADQAFALRQMQNQNMLFQGQLAAGRDYQGAIGASGQVDPNAFMRSIATDPGAAIAAPAMGDTALAQTHQQLLNQQAQSGLGSSYGSIATAAALGAGPAPRDQNGQPLAATDPQSIAHHSAQLALIQAQVNAGAIPQDIANKIVGSNTMPDGTSFTDVLANAGAIEAGGFPAQAMFGSPVQTQTGQTAVTNLVNPVSATSTPVSGPGGNIQLAQSPADLGQLISYQGQDGAQRSIPKGAIQTPQGAPIPNVKDASGNQITDANGALNVSLSPNAIALLNSTATNQADRASALQTAYEGSAARKALWQELAATQGDFVSGPGAKAWSDIVTEANRLFPSLNLSATQPATAAAAQQVFGKITAQLVGPQISTLGYPASNAGAEAAQLASPYAVYSPEANRQVIALGIGNEDLIQAKAGAWNKYDKLPNATYNGFVAQFNKSFDPRAAWSPYMTKQQKAAMLATMTPAEQAQYEANGARVQATMRKLLGTANQ